MTDQSTHLLEQVLGARSKIAALRILLGSKLGYSGSGVAKRAGMGLLAIQNALADLERLGLVVVERGAVEHRYRLNDKHYLVAHGLRFLFEGERGMLKSLIGDLRALLDGKVAAAGLFGSFVRGEASAGSDIDLLVIVETAREREHISALLTDRLPELTARFGLPVQPVIYERARVAASGGMQALLDEAEQDWVAIAGVNLRQLRASLAPARRKSA